MHRHALLLIGIAIIMGGCWWWPVSSDNAATPELVHSTNADLTVTPNPATVGDEVTFTLVFSNNSSLAAGIPSFSLQSVDGAAFERILGEALVAPDVLYDAVAPGKTHTETWTFVVQEVGEVSVFARVSYEVHEGYPGPAYWSGVQSPEVIVIVEE